jgi:hemoglobin
VDPGTEPAILAALGQEGFARLTAAFYRRVQTDDLLGPMYRNSLAKTGEDFAAAEARLRDFLLFRMGASDKYTRERGHPRLRGRHMPFAIDAAGAERWIGLMNESMAEIGVPEPAATQLRSYFSDTAMWMVNR